MTTKKMAYLSVLAALYVVLSAFLKFTLVGNIQVDLGYIAYSVALCAFGWPGIAVGVIGCSLESIVFSAYGFSISWACANLAVGLICAAVLYNKNIHIILKAITIIAGCAVGMLLIKTVIECNLYNIPLAVKLPKNAVAFGTDAVVMILGLLLYEWKLKNIKL